MAKEKKDTKDVPKYPEDVKEDNKLKAMLAKVNLKARRASVDTSEPEDKKKKKNKKDDFDI